MQVWAGQFISRSHIFPHLLANADAFLAYVQILYGSRFLSHCACPVCIFSTMVSIVRKLVREEGLQGLYRGLTSTWVREIPGYFCFFGGYELSRRFLNDDPENPSKLSGSRYCVCSISKSRPCLSPLWCWVCDVQFVVLLCWS